ncbi:MAG: hypothetical protein M1825_006115 [Sarcosagium campestre]|nr:MAG: hypothetical protein M1825_006115 [Sarcosagium campestre]
MSRSIIKQEVGGGVDYASFGNDGTASQELFLATESPNSQSRRHIYHVGSTTESEPCLLDLCSFDQNNESPIPRGAVRKVGDGDTFLMLADETSPPADDTLHYNQVIANIVAPHGPKLIEIYFDIVHPSFPILHKQSFLNDLTDPRRTVTPALLASVYILSLRWWPPSNSQNDSTKPDVSELESIALKSFEESIVRPKFSTVQAGLLLLQRTGGESWPITSQVVAVGQELGLHLDCSQWRIPSWERGLRKRLAWALFMQDKWGSLIHGRPSHIFSSNWAVEAVTDADFEGSTSEAADGDDVEAEKMRLLFTETIALTGLLSDVLDTFYTLQANQETEMAGKDGTKLILEKAKPIQIKLKDWFTRLPPCLRMDSLLTKAPSSTGKLTEPESGFRGIDRGCPGYLHLAYYATEITLHRCIVRSLIPAETDPYLLHICRSAAKTRLISAMDFVNRLKAEHLRAFWYCASRMNFALIGTFGSLLWATAPSREEADFYRLRLGEYRWTLSVSSRIATFIGFAVEALDGSTQLLQNLDEKPSISWAEHQAMRFAKDQVMGEAPHVVQSSDFEPSEDADQFSGGQSSGLASPSESSSTGSADDNAKGGDTGIEL